MDYRDILGIPKKKTKKVVTPQPPKPSITEKLSNEFGPLNEWSAKPPTEKRWSGAYSNNNSGLTEFERKGGKDSINETVPLGKIDKPKFMKYFDLVLKTAGSNKAEIYKILKRMMPSLDNRTLLYMAQGLEDAVKQMTGEE
jgi:hypothetical protein